MTYQGTRAMCPQTSTLDSLGVCLHHSWPCAAWKGWVGFPKVSTTSAQEVGIIMEVVEAEWSREKVRSPRILIFRNSL